MKVKHIVTGVVADVDDSLGKKLTGGSEWVSARAPRKTAEPKEPSDKK